MTTAAQPRTPFDLFHVECGEGWRNLYEPLMVLCAQYGYKVLQVKEKFGGLRFYVAGPRDPVDLLPLISAAELASFHMCEHCGEHGQEAGWDKKRNRPLYKAKTKGDGWILTLCDPCRAKRDAERAARSCTTATPAQVQASSESPSGVSSAAERLDENT